VAQYMITYLCGNPPSTPEEGKQHKLKYMDRLSSLGDAALRIAQACPFLEIGGSLEVSEIRKMPSQQ